MTEINREDVQSVIEKNLIAEFLLQQPELHPLFLHKV